MLVVVMIYGRTRALPQQVDYALTLAIEIPPSDKSPLQHRSRGVSGRFFTAAAVDRSPVELLLTRRIHGVFVAVAYRVHPAVPSCSNKPPHVRQVHA